MSISERVLVKFIFTKRDNYIYNKDDRQSLFHVVYSYNIFVRDERGKRFSTQDVWDVML